MEGILSFLTENGLAILLTAAVAYLLGSLSFAFIIVRLKTGKDIRTMGSGNAGTTNVLRNAGKLPALLTLVGDAGKAVLAVFAGRWIFTALGSASSSDVSLLIFGGYIAGVFCLLGHLFPLYFGFKGGKGVATTAGMLLVIDWRVLVFGLSIFIIVVLITRIVSLSSIIAGCSFPVASFVFSYFFDYRAGLYPLDTVIVSTVMSVLIAAIMVYMHKENMKRLRNHTEKRISLGGRKENA
nr:glycerol-3-phosphate 1-O-acyltransferase PlsY [uncultured Solibaculum sp.]